MTIPSAIWLAGGHFVPFRAPHALSGPTMGTVYHITIHGNLSQGVEKIQTAVDKRLGEIERSMSAWIPDSEISTINKMPENGWIPLSGEFDKVLGAALALSRKTDGAFDVTVGPLVNLWGFGPDENEKIPSPDQVRDVLKRIGYRNLENNGQRLKKNFPGMYLDFSAVMQGYGVDQIAALLEKNGIDDYSIEIGGEIRVKGKNPKGNPWVVGIETPAENAPQGADFISAVHLTSGALSTSGSYRIFREDPSGRRSHIIDPRTGEALHSDLVSVTVYAPTCMEADGAATALMVMGVTDGLKWVEDQKGMEALFVVRKSFAEFEQIMSSGFER